MQNYKWKMMFLLGTCMGCLVFSAATEAAPATNYVEVFRDSNDHPLVAYTNGMTVRDAINASGGYGKFASSEIVRVSTAAGGFVQLNRHDIDAGKTNVYTLQGGDTILLVRGNYVEVTGKVRHLGRVSFTNGMTVLDAINAAGGYDPKVVPTTIMVFSVGYTNKVTLSRRDVDARKSNALKLHEADTVFVMVGKTLEEDEQLDQARVASELEALPVSKSRLWLYTLGGWMADSPTNTVPLFHNHVVLGCAELASNDRKALWPAYVKGVRDWDGVFAACFNPRHGLRIITGSATNDFVICFECRKVEVYGFDDDRGFPISSSPLGEFNALVDKYHLKLKGEEP